MNRAGILPLVFLFAGTAIAQESLTSLTFGRPLRIDAAQCPVGLNVTHASGLPVASFAEGEQRQGPSINGQRLNGPAGQRPLHRPFQQLHLIFTNSSSREIVSAQITVHGWSKKGRTVELASASDAPDLARKVEVAMNVQGNGQASKDLSLSQFTAVTSLELNSITYGDGSTWHASPAGACSVTPDLLMAVSTAPAR